MHVAAKIRVVGALIVVAQPFTDLFSRTRVRDVLLLTVIGILLGPVLHVVTPANFGAIRPAFATAIPIILLFEAGLSLHRDILRGPIRGTISLTLVNFSSHHDAVNGLPPGRPDTALRLHDALVFDVRFSYGHRSRQLFPV
jgi:hypothetical protein